MKSGWIVAGLLLLGTVARGEPRPEAPRLYELMINGESFVIEADRVATLQSQTEPGARYEVALRVAAVQRVPLKSFQFEHDSGARVEVDRAAERVRAKLAHELGFSMHFTDFGGPLQAGAVAASHKRLHGSALAGLRDLGFSNVQAEKPHTRSFGATAGQGVTFRYKDRENFGHVNIVYLLTGPAWSGSVVVQYLENDAEDVLPLIKRTLESIRGVEVR